MNVPAFAKMVVAVCVCFCACTAVTATEDFVWRTEELKGFAPHESLRFHVRWKFITVGTATMEVRGITPVNGREGYHIYSEARSAAAFDNFYKVRDTNESWIDTQSLCSLQFASHINEAGHRRDETIVFDHPAGAYRILESSKTGSAPVFVQDVISALYYLRTRDLEVGKEISVDAQSGDKAWPLKIKVLRKEKIKVDAGTFKCIVVEPAIREGAGIFQAKGKLWVWLTDDARKLPVMMRSKIAVGSITAELREIK